MSKETYKQKVYKILEEWPKTRDNDGLLIAHYIHKHLNKFVEMVPDGDKKTAMIRLRDIQHMPAFENIRRQRAIIQNQDKELLPQTEGVRRARKINEQEWLDYVRDQKNMVQ